MRRSPKPWPLVISRTVDTCVAAVKASGVRGRARVYEDTENGETVYIVAIVIPAGETVPARAHGSR